MSDFFDTIGKRISDTVGDLGKKAGDTIDIQKKKNEIYGLKRDSERDMTEIGRLVYERFKQGEVVDTDFIALCEAIEKREEQTEVCEQEIARNVRDGEERRIWKGKGIYRKVHNKGLMMNHLDSRPKLVKGMSAAALGILFFWEHLLWKEPGRKLAKLGTSLMLGGAVGNTYDRFKRGYVVDYLSLKTKNRKLSDITFNLSDLALFAGAILTVWSSLFGKKR